MRNQPSNIRPKVKLTGEDGNVRGCAETLEACAVGLRQYLWSKSRVRRRGAGS